jgi:hypothetical protein
MERKVAPISEPVHSFTLVDLRTPTSPATHLALQACVGLYNREVPGAVYTLSNENDARWLEELPFEPAEITDGDSFLADCLNRFPHCVRYSYEEQQKLLPNILTVGAVLEAVPLDESFEADCRVLFDARVEFQERDTPFLATKYVYENYLEDTTGLAMLNPGYDAADSVVWNPSIQRDMDVSMVDFVFYRKLFVTFLVNGCVPLTRQKALMNEIAQNNPWARPIGVYGYANYWMVFGGYLFEAQTRCTAARNMGAIPTAGANNLSFFSSRRTPVVTGELVQNEPEAIDYDPTKTYVSFVVGDGDNVAFVLKTRAEWMRQRVGACRRGESSCPPLTWTLSPHLPSLAPDVLRWFYDMSHETGTDYFMLPPSGHLYAYPSSLEEHMQDEFVAATERDALLLGTRSTVNWEWWTTWRRAERDFLPKYGRKGGAISGLFPVNVPYVFPTFTWWPGQYFKILEGPGEGRVALFRPREWRGIESRGNMVTDKFYLSPEAMAGELASYPRGTVAYVYMTSDGGLNLQNSFMAMAEMLPDHVRLVSSDTASRLALEAGSY